MRSSRGFAGGLAFLLGLPIAALSQRILGVDPETIIHLLFGVGFALIALSVVDFRTPRWIAWLGSVSAGAWGAIFLLQGVSAFIHDDSLTHFAYQVLGQRIERTLPDFLLLWFVGLLLSDSHGGTRLLGIATVPVALGADAYLHAAAYRGFAARERLRLLLLLPLVWLLFESSKSR